MREYFPDALIKCQVRPIFPAGPAAQISEDYVNRVVGSIFDLQEKIAIFDAGLDDRVIEICKVLVGSELQQAQPDAVFDDLLFYSMPGEGYRLALMREGVMFASISLPADVYQEVKNKYRPLLDQSGDDTVIDMEWVMRTVNRMITE